MWLKSFRNIPLHVLLSSYSCTNPQERLPPPPPPHTHTMPFFPTHSIYNVFLSSQQPLCLFSCVFACLPICLCLSLRTNFLFLPDLTFNLSFDISVLNPPPPPLTKQKTKTKTNKKKPTVHLLSLSHPFSAVFSLFFSLTPPPTSSSSSLSLSLSCLLFIFLSTNRTCLYFFEKTARKLWKWRSWTLRHRDRCASLLQAFRLWIWYLENQKVEEKYT